MELQRRQERSKVFFTAFMVLFAIHAQAANEVAQTFTLDGQLSEKGTSDPLEDGSVKLVLQVLDSSKRCLLYEETQTVNTSSSSGYFNIKVGSITGAGKRTSNDPGRTMAQIFQNTVGISAANAPGQTCPSGTYTPSAYDARYLRVLVTPSATNVEDTLSPDIEIGSAPTAVTSQTVQGYSPSQFLFIGTGDLTQANLQAVFASGNATKLQTLLSINPSNYVTKDSSNGLVQIPSGSGTPTGVQAGQIWYDTGVLKYYDGSTVKTLSSGSGITSITVGTGLTPQGTISSTGSIAVDVGTGANKVVQLNGSAQLPAVDGSLLTAVSATKLQGNAVSSTTLVSGDSGKAYVWNGSSFAAKFIGIGDLRNAAGTAYFPQCTSAQTLTWVSASDTLSCTTIEVSSSNVSFGTQTANTFFAAPNGSNGAPTFRALVAADLPSSGVTASTYRSVTVDAYGRVTAGTNPTTISGYGLTDAVVNGGQAGAVTIGPSDSNDLKLQSGGGTKVTLNSSGQLGVGTTGPTELLEVAGTTGTSAAYLSLNNISSGSLLGAGIRMKKNGTSQFGIGVDYNGNGTRNFWFYDYVAAKPRMLIDPNGKMGVGTTSPGQLFQVGASGDSTVAVANAWNTFSDRRLKDIIGPIPQAGSIVDQLTGYYYTWKKGEDTSRQVGVIAQEVEAVLPELVKTGSDGIKTVDYPKLSAVLIEALKEVRRENESLKSNLQQLQGEKQTQQDQLHVLEQRLKAIEDRLK
ncbi:MAG: tail fiber domain-containing protein [Bdellovibrio sp.]